MHKFSSMDIGVSAFLPPLYLTFVLLGVLVSSSYFYLFQIVGRDIGGGDAGFQAFDIDHDSVLAGDAGNAAGDAFERAGGDAHQVIGHEAARLYIYLHDVLVLQGSDADKGFQVPGTEGQGWVLAALVCVEMVVVVGGVIGFLGALDVLFGLLRCGIDEKDVHEGEQLALFPARQFVADVFPDLGQVDVGAVFHDGIGHGLHLAVFDTQDVPLPVFGRCIPYRHPCL